MAGDHTLEPMLDMFFIRNGSVIRAIGADCHARRAFETLTRRRTSMKFFRIMHTIKGRCGDDAL